MRALVLALALAAVAAADPFYGAELDLFRQATALCAAGSYPRAARLVEAHPGFRAHDPRLLALRATISVSAFVDLHDPAELALAQSQVARAIDALEKDGSERGRFHLALALMQESYIRSLRREELSAALSGRRAAKLCDALIQAHPGAADLKGILGSYLFWKAQALGPLRGLFGGDTRTKGLRWVFEAANDSTPLAEAYRNSLFWMLYELGRHREALALADRALARNPGSRIWKQARADALRRLGRYPEALAGYRAGLSDYLAERVPVNRMSAAANIAFIHFTLGARDSARAWIDTIDAPRNAAMRPWFPPSLVRELDPVRRALAKPAPPGLR